MRIALVNICLFFVVSFCTAGVFRISSDEINSLSHYEILELIKNLPGVRTAAFDATDIALVSGGYNSLVSSNIVFLYDGLPLGKFHDRTTWISGRWFLNTDIDTIEVITGPDTYTYCDHCATVVNIVPKGRTANRKEKSSVCARTYVGSEVGDPVIYQYILPPDSIPYNKEQYAAGEVSAQVNVKRLSVKSGLAFVYLDRYSDRYESDRNIGFGIMNPSQSLNEQNKGTIQAGIGGKTVNTDVRVAVNDYRTFKYNHRQKRYYHYKGQRNNFYSKTSLNIGDNTCSLALSGFMDDAYISVKEDVGNTNRICGYAASASFNRRLREGLNLGVRLQKQDDVFYGDTEEIDAMLTSTDYAEKRQSDDNRLRGSMLVTTENRLCNIGIYSTPGLRLFGEKEISHFGTCHWDVGVMGGVYHGWETASEVGWRFSYRDLIKVFGVVDIIFAPQRSLVDQSDRILSPGVTGGVTPWCLGDVSLHVSRYETKASWKKQLDWYGLSVTGQVDYYGQMWWDAFGMPVMRSNASSAGVVKLREHVTAGLQASYNLLDGKCRLSISLQDIGKKHYELPDGGLIGMVIITNCTLKL